VPAKTDARREVVPGVSQGLTVITQAEINRQIAAQVDVVLDKRRVKPLRQLVAADAEVDRLRVVLHVGQRQLSERRRRVIAKCEGAEDRSTGLAASSARRVMHDAATEAEIVHSGRPRQSVGELHLMPPEI